MKAPGASIVSMARPVPVLNINTFDDLLSVAMFSFFMASTDTCC
jgi:hypothetical protein